ncbi:hypothetical protein HDZ31DRAFT_85344 [Schizophyllum fasciatum]
MRFFGPLIWLSAALMQLCSAAHLPRDGQVVLAADLRACITRLSNADVQHAMPMDWQDYACDIGTDFVLLPRSALPPHSANTSNPGTRRSGLARRGSHTRRDDCKEDLADLEHERDELEKQLEDLKHSRIGYILLAVGAGAFALVLAACLAAQICRVKRGKKKYRVLSQQFDGGHAAGARSSVHGAPGAPQQPPYDDPFPPRKEGHVPMRSVASLGETSTMVSGKQPGYGHDRFGSYSSVRSSEDTVRDEHGASGSRPASRVGLPSGTLGKGAGGGSA